MPILKKTGIRSTFFPDGTTQPVDGAEHEQHEDASTNGEKNDDNNIVLIVSFVCGKQPALILSGL